MSEELLRGIEEYTEFLTPITELIDELNDVSDEEEEMILRFEEGTKRQFTQPGNAVEEQNHNRDTLQSPVVHAATEYNIDKRHNLPASPRPTSAPTTMLFQNSPTVTRTPTFNNTPIINSMSTPASIRSFSSHLEGFSPYKMESPTGRTRLQQPSPSPLSSRSWNGSPIRQQIKDEPIVEHEIASEQNETHTTWIPSRPQPPSESDTITVNKHDYTVLTEIGRGSIGRVFQVLSHTYSEIFALKWIHVPRQEDREEVLNEINMLTSLKDQEQIVKLLDYDVQSDIIRMILECGEADLSTLIQTSLNEQLDLSFVRYYWNQMLQAVLVVHRRKIVHSDLKPANFVIVKGWLKLIDFGIAMKSPDDTTSIYRTAQSGTVDYMAPETLVDNGDNEDLTKLGRSSDIWSLGCMLYELVYGEVPFHKLALNQKVINKLDPDCGIPFPSSVERGRDKIIIPPMLIELLKKCLDRNPLSRPTIFDLLKDPFVNTC